MILHYLDWLLCWLWHNPLVLFATIMNVSSATLLFGFAQVVSLEARADPGEGFALAEWLAEAET
jgi:hypothetical protein